MSTSHEKSQMKLALHACCGPCLLEPHDALVVEAERVVVVYSNSNIHPASEYERRRDTLIAYAQDAGIEVVELEYRPDEWVRTAGTHAGTPADRCRACYRMRLDETARWARDHGFDALSTTLTVSPYQDPEAIAEEGRAVAAEFGLEFVVRDFRDRYPVATRRSRELGMYRQNYCGCVMSDLEAAAQRASRRAAKREGR